MRPRTYPWRGAVLGVCTVLAFSLGRLTPRAPAPVPACTLVHSVPASPADLPQPVSGAGFRWFVTSTAEHYTPYFYAAVTSARKHSDVAPRLVLHPDADIPRLRDAAARLGVVVLHHRMSHDAALRRGVKISVPGYSDEAGVMTARGTFMRFDVPLLAAAETLGTTFEWVADHTHEAAAAMAARPPRDNLCLYTDADVLFLPGAALMDDIASGELAVPDVFSASSEINVTDYDHFNSGVMLINIAGFLRVVNDLWERSARNDFECMKDAWDQGCLQVFARDGGVAMARLAPQWNWRPYLRWPEDAAPPGARRRIMHFHGPKPLDIINTFVVPKVFNGGSVADNHGDYKSLIERDPQAYLHALAEWLKVAWAVY